MKKYIAFLRGINVGGKNKLSMKELKQLMQRRGYKNVETYINSGNIIFSSQNTDNELLKSNLEDLIFEILNFSIIVMLMSAEEFIEAVRNAPDWWDADKDSKHNAIFVVPPITVDEVCNAVGEAKKEYEKVSSFGKVIFWSSPQKTFSRTRWSKVVGKSVYTSITIRNSNTINKLLDMLT